MEKNHGKPCIFSCLKSRGFLCSFGLKYFHIIFFISIFLLYLYINNRVHH